MGLKAIVTIVDDNGMLLCKDRLVFPVKDEIVNISPHQPPLVKTIFKFEITQLSRYWPYDEEGGEKK